MDRPHILNKHLFKTIYGYVQCNGISFQRDDSFTQHVEIKNSILADVKEKSLMIVQNNT